jgi:hypothetical protein
LVVTPYAAIAVAVVGVAVAFAPLEKATLPALQTVDVGDLAQIRELDIKATERPAS